MQNFDMGTATSPHFVLVVRANAHLFRDAGEAQAAAESMLAWPCPAATAARCRFSMSMLCSTDSA